MAPFPTLYGPSLPGTFSVGQGGSFGRAAAPGAARSRERHKTNARITSSHLINSLPSSLFGERQVRGRVPASRAASLPGADHTHRHHHRQLPQSPAALSCDSRPGGAFVPFRVSRPPSGISGNSFPLFQPGLPFRNANVPFDSASNLSEGSYASLARSLRKAEQAGHEATGRRPDMTGSTPSPSAKSHSAGGGSPDRSPATRLTRGGSQVKVSPVGVPSLQEEESTGGRGTVDQVPAEA